MKRVRLVQLLCPARHCIIAVSYESPDGAAQECYTSLLRLEIGKLRLNPWCGICGSANLSIEDEATIFETLDAAQPTLRALQERNAAARAAIDRMRNN